MKGEALALRTGAAVIVLAIVFRLASGGAFGPVIEFFSQGKTAAFLLRLETGRTFRLEAPETTFPEPETQPLPEPVSLEDLPRDMVAVQSFCGYDPDMEALLYRRLDWQLAGEEPTVLILHSHGSESYQNTENYVQSAPFRTLDEAYNMVSVGERVAALLEAAGIGVVHDRTLHDYPSYNDAYSNSRTAAREYLEQYPSIRLVLDLHRDALEDSSGNQIGYTVDLGDRKAAKLMLVIGSDAGGSDHSGWEENMALAAKLHAMLESRYPGICRPICLRSYDFNQDLSAGAVLVEVGAAGNTRQEALAAAECLAESIIALGGGAA